MLTTGIPPHVELLRQLQRNEQSILAVPQLVLSGVREIVDGNGLIAGHITRSYFESTLESTVTKAVEVALGGTTSSAVNASESAASCGIDVLVYHWGGSLHKLPEQFEFPSVDVSTALSLWWLGNPIQKHQPYWTIETRDLNASNQRKAFYEGKYIMEKLTQFNVNATGRSLV